MMRVGELCTGDAVFIEHTAGVLDAVVSEPWRLARMKARGHAPPAGVLAGSLARDDVGSVASN